MVRPSEIGNNPAIVQSIRWLRASVALSFAITLLMSKNLWLSTRAYSLTPIWSGLPQVQFPIDHILFAMAIAGLLYIAALPLARWCIWSVCGVGLVWVALDQSRWQPYVIHYLVLLGGLLLIPREDRDNYPIDNVNWAMMPSRLLLAFTYFYAGIQKFNYQYVTSVFPWLMSPLKVYIGIDVSHFSSPMLFCAAIGVAAAEATAGILLLIPRTSRRAALFLMGMHTFIMLIIGPFGHNWNKIVWPWNLALIIILWSLFVNYTGDIKPSLDFFSRSWWSQALFSASKDKSRKCSLQNSLAIAFVIFFFGIMPALSFWNLWDSYPSFSLYSGNIRHAKLKVDPADIEPLPISARSVAQPDGTIDLTKWSIAEMGVVSYPEDRIALNVGRSLARSMSHGPVYVELRGKPHPFTGESSIRIFRCPIGGGPPKEVPQSDRGDARSRRF